MSRADRLIRGQLRSRFLVTTHAGATWSGVLVDADDRTLVLADVQAMAADGSATPADGRIYLPRLDVAYMQLT